MYRILLFTLMSLLLSACGDTTQPSESHTESESDSGPTEGESDCVNYTEGDMISLTTLCEKIQCDCGGWGWDDVAHCESGFMGFETTRCSNEEGYFICSAYCIPQNCTGFEACENACWEEFCR